MKPSEVPVKLKEWRKLRGLSQGQAAPVLGISRRTLENWEQGRAPEAAALNVMAALLKRPKTKARGLES